MNEKCATCAGISMVCKGPRFEDMSAQEILVWCKARRAFLRWTNAKVAEEAKMPKGTIDRIFAGEHVDFRWETICPILRALRGGTRGDTACPDAPEGAGAAIQAEIDGLRKVIAEHEDEVKRLRHEIDLHVDKNAALQKMNDAMQTLVTNTNARFTKDKDFLRAQITSKNKVIAVLAVCFGVCLAVIVAALIVDKLNPGVGFFWLRSLNLFGGNNL